MGEGGGKGRGAHKRGKGRDLAERKSVWGFSFPFLKREKRESPIKRVSISPLSPFFSSFMRPDVWPALPLVNQCRICGQDDDYISTTYVVEHG